MNAIEEIEISSERYRRARCKRCKKKIMPLEIRASVLGRFTGYLCEKCARMEIEVIPIHLKKIIERLDKLSKMSDEEKRTQLNRMMILKKLE